MKKFPIGYVGFTSIGDGKSALVFFQPLVRSARLGDIGVVGRKRGEVMLRGMDETRARGS